MSNYFIVVIMFQPKSCYEIWKQMGGKFLITHQEHVRYLIMKIINQMILIVHIP